MSKSLKHWICLLLMKPSDIFIDDNLSYNQEDVNTDDCNVDEETEGAKSGCNYTYIYSLSMVLTIACFCMLSGDNLCIFGYGLCCECDQ